MGEFPSGQRGQTVNLLAMPSMVRIHLPPPKIPIVLLDGRYFSLSGRWSRSLSPSGEIHLPPPKYRLSFWTVGIFMPSPGRNGWIVTAFSSRRRLEKPHSGSPAAQTLWENLPMFPLTLPVHTAAAPAPGATGRSPARRNSRRTPSVRHAHTAIDTPPPTPAAAQSTPHIAASASPLSGCEFFMRLNNYCLRLYSLG